MAAVAVTPAARMGAAACMPVLRMVGTSTAAISMVAISMVAISTTADSTTVAYFSVLAQVGAGAVGAVGVMAAGDTPPMAATMIMAMPLPMPRLTARRM